MIKSKLGEFELRNGRLIQLTFPKKIPPKYLKMTAEEIYNELIKGL